MSVVTRTTAAFMIAGSLTAATAATALPASAATRQSGLVNVSATDTNVQVPIGVAANICNVAVNALATGLANGAAPCDAVADPSATNPVTPSSGNTRQQGLVNLSLTGTNIQIPIAVAANVCNVAVNVLAQQLQNGAAQCTAPATPTAG